MAMALYKEEEEVRLLKVRGSPHTALPAFLFLSRKPLFFSRPLLLDTLSHTRPSDPSLKQHQPWVNAPFTSPQPTWLAVVLATGTGGPRVSS